ncbi:hypothetical protein LGM96_34610 [Burkholderia gladioli]|uniref:hypothetical protein n=1 Tax=Burkholderia gladioli TaxID=28095 RepID=UPI001CF15E04|nr:hypothetical protein [Burkholderia gladioli]MCA8172476.1 hypothetical protein [Burkholderia gladioli]
MSTGKGNLLKDAHVEKEEPGFLKCGIVMPIATMDGLPADHWLEVKSIIIDAVGSIEVPKFSVALVSDSEDVGVIHKRIVQGVYQADIVVCDVSGKNPNVLFELGMRLAFDKPTVIIKDDKTDYMFDTGVIEHLTYPRDLRFQKIIAFKDVLAKKVLATYNASKSDPDHSTFLKSFGTFKVAQLKEKEASAETVMLEMLADMQKEVRILRQVVMPVSQKYPDPKYVSMSEVYQMVERADKLMRYGGADSWHELEAMRGPLNALLRSKSLPKNLYEKLSEVVAGIGPSLVNSADQDTEKQG